MALNELVNTVRRRVSGVLAPSASVSLSIMPDTIPLLPPRPPSARKTQAGIRAGSSPYNAASSGRRTLGWNGTSAGVNTAIAMSQEKVRIRCHEEIRNNPYAASACDNFESQTIGNGIKPGWNLDDKNLEKVIEKEWARWAGSRNCDYAGLLNFYGMQALAAREVFEEGEVFARFYSRTPKWGLRIPFQVQLIEGEQLPINRDIPKVTGSAEGATRCGIKFDLKGRRMAYDFFREHPGDSMYYQADSNTFLTIPAEDVAHVYKPLRAGQLRGMPMLSATLTLLHQIDKYMDAAVEKKIIQTMFAAFIEKTDLQTIVLPEDTSVLTSPDNGDTSAPLPPELLNGGVGVTGSVIETGTMQELLPNEKVIFPTLPQDNDIEIFLKVNLHRLAVGLGATYYQITGDVSQASYSSIRASIVDFRRKCEQIQRNVFVQQLCQPVAERWLVEAVLAGVLVLPGFDQDPSDYFNITWSTPAWAWVDPLKDVQASKMEVRCGFRSRESVVRERSEDVENVDAEQKVDNDRADAMELTYDSDGRIKDLGGTPVTPEEEAEAQNLIKPKPAPPAAPAPAKRRA